MKIKIEESFLLKKEIKLILRPPKLVLRPPNEKESNQGVNNKEKTFTSSTKNTKNEHQTVFNKNFDVNKDKKITCLDLKSLKKQALYEYLKKVPKNISKNSVSIFAFRVKSNPAIPKIATATVAEALRAPRRRVSTLQLGVVAVSHPPVSRIGGRRSQNNPRTSMPGSALQPNFFASAPLSSNPFTPNFDLRTTVILQADRRFSKVDVAWALDHIALLGPNKTIDEVEAAKCGLSSTEIYIKYDF